MLAAWRKKEGELEFEYLPRKSRCEILIGGDDNGSDLITLGTCLSMVFFIFYIRARFNPLRDDWRKSDSSVDGKPLGNCRWNSNSSDLVASSPSFSHSVAIAPRKACSQVN